MSALLKDALNIPIIIALDKSESVLLIIVSFVLPPKWMPVLFNNTDAFESFIILNLCRHVPN